MENPKKTKLAISFFMKDCVDYIIRNHEEIAKKNETEINKEIPYSFSPSLLHSFISSEMSETISTEDFWGSLFKMGAVTDSEISLFLEYDNSDFPQLTNLKVQLDSNKNGLSLKPEMDVSERLKEDEIISFTITSENLEGEIIDFSGIPEQVIQQGTIMLIPNPEYLTYLTERDEKLIQAELKKHEAKLRKELKETGRLSSVKQRLNLG